MKKKLLLTLMIPLINACAYFDLKTEVHSSPLVNLSGPNVAIRVVDESGKRLRNPFADTIADEAQKVLASKGFKVVEKTADAHLILFFTPGSQNRQVNVPGHSYAIPVYSPAKTTTFSGMDSNGNAYFGSAQSQGSTQWVPQYQEGYVANVQDQWLMSEGIVQIHGEYPRSIYKGQIFRTDANTEFLGSETNLRVGVKKLLNDTPLKNIDRAPASSADKKPGCRVTIGVQFEKDLVDRNQIYQIKSFIDESKSQDSGLMVGDEIKRINGVDFASLMSDRDRLESFYKSGDLKVAIMRNKKAKDITVKPTLLCPEF